MTQQPPETARYSPLADLHHRYPNWRLNFTDDPAAPPISFQVHYVVVLNLARIEGCPELALTRAVARLDVCHGDMAVITDKHRQKAEALAQKRFSRSMSESSLGRVVPSTTEVG